MSVKASNYIGKLTVAPNGEPLTSTEKLVLFALAWHHNVKTGRCDPSVRRIAKECVLSRSTVVRTLRSLEHKDLIRTERRTREHNSSPTSNAYTFTALPWPHSTARGSPTVGPGVVPQWDGGGPTVGPVGEQELEQEDRKGKKENSLSHVLPRGENGSEPTWTEWAALYNSGNVDGITPVVGGGYLAQAAKADIAPPSTLEDLHALIDLIRMLKDGLGVAAVKLPSPNDLANLIQAAHAWRTFCEERPEFATFDGLQDFFQWTEPRRGWNVINKVYTVSKLKAKLEERAQEQQAAQQAAQRSRPRSRRRRRPEPDKVKS